MTPLPTHRGEQPPPPLHLRGVTEGDLEALALLEREIFPEEPYPYFVLRQMYDLHPGHLLVLDDGTALKGYVLVATPPDDGPSWVLGLGITRDERGRGHGRRLMREALRRLRADGVREVCLTVDPANLAAIVLYESLGFTADEGVRKDYFGPGADRLVMRRSL
ncbi:GNAT family N-acetyltransferase [Streptomyces sp. NPDC101152]|uniref:GNAT family N-acetyltransferase n=1 Tax=Streptomyces sp. NPDC101152 TaxID=3366116 RepID=UPI003819A9EF